MSSPATVAVGNEQMYLYQCWLYKRENASLYYYFPMTGKFLLLQTCFKSLPFMFKHMYIELSGLIFEGFLYNSKWLNTVLTGPLIPYATLNMYSSS